MTGHRCRYCRRKSNFKGDPGEFPEDDILAEESASHDSLSENRTWIVDPIDGTTNFANDFPIYCVSVAMWEKKNQKWV
jgi:fructose-1,6-bisphosphatase/inositol monophosphatase family enzyme